MAEVAIPRELGVFIRERRRSLELTQAVLAARVGTTRRWLLAVERGKPGAELGLVLQTLQALGVRVMLKTSDSVPGHLAGTASARSGESGAVSDAAGVVTDIDSIVARARKR